MITMQELHADKFDVDLHLTFLNFRTRSSSNSSMWQPIVNMINPLNMPASCCNYTGSNVLHIKIWAKFNDDHCTTLLSIYVKWSCEHDSSSGILAVWDGMFRSTRFLDPLCVFIWATSRHEFLSVSANFELWNILLIEAFQSTKGQLSCFADNLYVTETQKGPKTTVMLSLMSGR